jgi:hypothetical protein
VNLNAIAVALLSLATVLPAPAQQAQSAAQMQSGQPAQPAGETEEQHGHRLLAEMVKALGGDAWLNKRTVTIEGQTASFFRSQPTGAVGKFLQQTQFAQGSTPELTRVAFLSSRGMFTPGMKKDVIHIWSADNGYEFTYKGRTSLPADQVADYMRRRAHSLEEVMHTWVKAPGVMVIFEGTDMRDRHTVDKVTILSANNDAVTIELDQDSHLPLDRNFEWRNQQFKDHDRDDEVYGDWRAYDGIETPMNVTRYRNGDMVDQTFYTKVTFNTPLDPGLLDIDRQQVEKKK